MFISCFTHVCQSVNSSSHSLENIIKMLIAWHLECVVSVGLAMVVWGCACKRTGIRCTGIDIVQYTTRICTYGQYSSYQLIRVKFFVNKIKKNIRYLFETQVSFVEDSRNHGHLEILYFLNVFMFIASCIFWCCVVTSF